jgi:hypothetical protein
VSLTLKYWQIILHMDNQELVKKCYDWQKDNIKSDICIYIYILQNFSREHIKYNLPNIQYLLKGFEDTFFGKFKVPFSM